jgi:hypothetical protein
MQVRHAAPGQQPILAHILGSVLRRGLADPTIARSLAIRQGAHLTLAVSGMVVTLELGDGEVVIHPGRPFLDAAELRSDIRTLVQLVAGGSLVGAFLRGRVGIRGNPLRLLPLLPLLRPAEG